MDVLKPPPIGPLPVSNTPDQLVGEPYDAQMARRYAGATHLTPPLADVVDLAAQMDANAIRNIVIEHAANAARS